MHRLVTASVICALASPGLAALDTTDPSIIVLHRYDEQSSGQLDNNVPTSFVDTAPTGSAQNHESFDDGASDGPAWSGGAAFESGGNAVGTGTGLAFTASDGDHSRYGVWMNQSEGNYAHGGSFTLMVRMYANGIADGAVQGLTGTSSNYLQLQGASGGTRAVLQSRLREGAGGGETSFYHDSLGSSGAITAAGGAFYVDFNKWYNLFLIYDATGSVTVAADDGTTFSFLSTDDIGLPASSFDSLANGFADSDRLHGVGVLGYGASPFNTFDGRIESLVVYDRALTFAEADAIDLTNLPVPEPATACLLGSGMLLLSARRRNRQG